MNSPENPVQGRKCPDCEVVLPTVTDVFLHMISAHEEKFERLYRAVAKVPTTIEPVIDCGFK